MDPAVVKVIHDAFKIALEDPGVIATMAKYDMFPRYLSSDAYTKSVAELYAQETKTLTELSLLRKD